MTVHIVPVCEKFLGAAEQRARHAAIRRRLMTPVRKTAKPAEATTAEVVMLPAWATTPCMFDEHVLSYRVECAVRDRLERIESGEAVAPKPTIDTIVRRFLVSRPGVRVCDLKGGSRFKDVCLVRQEAMHEVKTKRPDLSFTVIGRWFGGRDHTTVLHAVRKIAAMKEAGEA